MIMKTIDLRSSILAVSAVTGLVFASGNATAQDSNAAAAPQLSYSVAQVLKLEQAKVGDSVILNYVQSSGVTYDLKADEIVYLKHQGVSDNVLNAMMNQRTHVAAPTEPAAAPSVTYIQQQPAQSSTVYVVPTSPTYYYAAPAYTPYYGGYSYWPPISLSFAWGSYGGGGSHYYGGWHGGGWHH